MNDANYKLQEQAFTVAGIGNNTTEGLIGEDLVQPATQIHFNFGIQQPNSINQQMAMMVNSQGGPPEDSVSNIAQQRSGSAKDLLTVAGVETPFRNEQSLKAPSPKQQQNVEDNSLMIKPKEAIGLPQFGDTYDDDINEEQFHNLNNSDGGVGCGVGLTAHPGRKHSASPTNLGWRGKQRLSQQSRHLEIQSSSESSPASPIVTKIDMLVDGSPNTAQRQAAKFFKEEVQMHRDAYEKVSKFYPPNPILPKSFLVYDDSPRSGGEFAYIKLLKFRGKDLGKSKFEIERGVNQIEFTEGVTLKQIFAPPPESLPDERKTPFGEIVYLRSVLDFNVKQHQAGNRKDEVLEENLLDVRRILKNTTNNGPAGNAAAQQNQGKKGLINLQGVDQFYKKKDTLDKTLLFESRFESGNLAAALKVSDTDYHLLLQNDVNTSGHTQWFFFRVQNTRKFSHVRFNILNLSKPDSLFNEGMKVLVYSEKQGEDKDIGWHRSCYKISYYHNGIRKDHQKKTGNNNNKTLYTLTFTYEFLYDDDTVYFAYCYPYGYSDMLDDLTKISTDPAKSSFCSRRTLCMSLAGNKVEMLTITSKNNLDNMSKRKGVFITARVHPGESVGSWMMKGAVDFLTDENNEEAEILRQNYVFKIIPMLNPDGVINGNYRCSLAGCDLNRRWKAPSKMLHPCIYYTKQLLQQFSKERELVVFCDFHGHSRRKNIFMYGCHNPQQPEETRLYPYLLSKICPFFSFGYSRFGNQKSKEATARIAMFNDIKIPAIYTMESSFCGMDEGPFANYHFSTDNLMQTGRDFCRTLLLFNQIQTPSIVASTLLQQVMSLLDFYKQENDKKDLFNKDSEVEAMNQFTEKMRQYNLQQREINTKQIRKALLQVLRTTHDVDTGGESSSSAGSDRAPSEDNLEPEEIQMVVPTLEDEQAVGGVRKGRKGGKKGDASGTAQLNTQDTTTSVSPQRRKGAITEQSPAQQKKPGALLKGAIGSVQQKPKTQQLLKKNEGSNSKTNLLKTTIEEGSKEEEEAEPKVEEQINQIEADDTVTHKKKRKRNVESRDAWTQTDRSDYMLIKYRQKQKLALQMAKSQKFTKEEQMMYEQALLYHKAQQKLNKTHDQNSGNSPSVGYGQQQSTIRSTKDQLAQGANGPRVLHLQQNMFAVPDATPQQQQQNISGSLISAGNQRGTSGQTTLIKKDRERQSDGSQVTQANVNVSRNLSSAQGGSKGKQKGANNTPSAGQILGVAGKSSQVLQNSSNNAIKAQQGLDPQIRQVMVGLIPQNQQNNGFPAIQSPSLPTHNKRQKGATIASSSGTVTMSPPKKGSGAGMSQAEIMALAQHAVQMQPQSDMSSSHSTQRIINPKIGGFNGIANSGQVLIDLSTPGGAMISQMNPNMMVVLPHQTASQRGSFVQGQQQQQNILPQGHNQQSKHPKSVPSKRFGGGNGQAPTSNEQSNNMFHIDLNSTPVLENAYIQKRLLQQMQMQQQQIDQQMAEQAKQEYGSLRATFLNQANSQSPQQNLASNHHVSSSQNHNAATIKKLLEQQWQHQQLQQSSGGFMNHTFYNQMLAQQQMLMGAAAAQNGTPSTAVPGHRARKTVSTKNNPVTQSQPGPTTSSMTQQQQFINIQQNNEGSPMKGAAAMQQQQHQNHGGVKISIVNVHNQFNIHNNIIINNPTGAAMNSTAQGSNNNNPFGMNQNISQSPQKGGTQSQTHQYQHMHSAGLSGGAANTSFYAKSPQKQMKTHSGASASQNQIANSSNKK